jgi:6-phosphofructo-2-kinase
MPHHVHDTLERANSFPITATHPRRQSQHSIYAKSVLMSKIAQGAPHATATSQAAAIGLDATRPAPQVLPPATIDGPDGTGGRKEDRLKPRPRFSADVARISKDGVGAALSDTPAPSLPASPRMCVAQSHYIDISGDYTDSSAEAR